MQYHHIKNPSALADAIEQLLNQDEQTRLYKKLLAVLLVAKHPENNSSEIARQLGYNKHTIARWVRSVCREDGFDLSGLEEKKKAGRKKRLSKKQLSKINNVLDQPPPESPAKKWSGKLLSDYILNEFNVVLQVRQCQKIIKLKRTQK